MGTEADNHVDLGRRMMYQEGSRHSVSGLKMQIRYLLFFSFLVANMVVCFWCDRKRRRNAERKVSTTDVVLLPCSFRM